MQMRYAAATAAALLALTTGLAACDRKSDEKAGPDAAPGAEPAPTAAAASPRLRAGLWQVTMSSEDGPDAVSRMCLDDAVQARINAMGAQASAGACQETVMRPRPGGGFTFRTVCDASAMGGGTSVSEGEITGDFRTAYASRSTVTTTGAAVAHMNRASTVSAVGVHQGACPADMKPGDMEIPGGMRFNMAEMAEMAGKMETPGGR